MRNKHRYDGATPYSRQKTKPLRRTPIHYPSHSRGQGEALVLEVGFLCGEKTGFYIDKPGNVTCPGCIERLAKHLMLKMIEEQK